MSRHGEQGSLAHGIWPSAVHLIRQVVRNNMKMAISGLSSTTFGISRQAEEGYPAGAGCVTGESAETKIVCDLDGHERGCRPLLVVINRGEFDRDCRNAKTESDPLITAYALSTSSMKAYCSACQSLSRLSAISRPVIRLSV